MRQHNLRQVQDFTTVEALSDDDLIRFITFHNNQFLYEDAAERGWSHTAVNHYQTWKEKGLSELSKRYPNEIFTVNYDGITRSKR
jgi:hypothetical protein